jgi:hypothetical protein
MNLKLIAAIIRKYGKLKNGLYELEVHQSELIDIPETAVIQEAVPENGVFRLQLEPRKTIEGTCRVIQKEPCTAIILYPGA